jgi:hypothetical protein
MAWRSVLKNLNLLNCILIGLCLIFAYPFLFPQSEGKISLVLPPSKKKPIEKTQNEPPKAQTPSPMDYVVIADENLFHPERRIPPEKKEEAALPKPDFVLYGTLITPELKMAYMEDKKAPVTTPGRGKRQSAIKIGESLSGFTLKEVDASKVVLTRGEETMTVLLDDSKSPKTREGAAAAPGTQPQIPGIPGIPTAGQPVSRPASAGPGLVPPAGSMTPNPMPGTMSPAPQQPAFPGAVAPSTPGGGQAFPSPRQRYLQPKP